MKISLHELGTRTREIIEALDRNEKVTIYDGNKKKGTIYPSGLELDKEVKVEDLPAFGMWKDREDMKDVDK